MFLYDGYALGTASTMPGNEFTEADCSLSIRGGVTFRRSHHFNAHGISFELADSNLSGTGEVRRGLYVNATSASVVIENLDILGRIHVDRIEARMYSECRTGDTEPTTSIVGSKFQNFRIDGNLLEIHTSDDLSSRYPTFRNMQIAFQNPFSRNQVMECFVGRDLDEMSATTDDLRAVYEAYRKQSALPTLDPPTICSIVTKVRDGEGTKAWGSIIAIPNVGILYLGEVIILPGMRCLNMFRIELSSGGSIVGGCAVLGGAQYSGVLGDKVLRTRPTTHFGDISKRSKMPDEQYQSKVDLLRRVLDMLQGFLAYCRLQNIEFGEGALDTLCRHIGKLLAAAAMKNKTTELFQYWDKDIKTFFSTVLAAAEKRSPIAITTEDIQNAREICPRPPDF